MLFVICVYAPGSIPGRAPCESLARCVNACGRFVCEISISVAFDFTHLLDFTHLFDFTHLLDFTHLIDFTHLFDFTHLIVY